MSERIQKILAASGVGSRREIEKWIRQGRITVDGKLSEIGQIIDEKCKVLLDGKVISISPSSKIPKRIIVYNKPVGEICSQKDPQNRPTVFEAMPKIRGSKWISIGRLDINTSGLLLITNNGEIAHRLMHPSFNIEREYLCRVQGSPSVDQLKQLLNGVYIDDYLCKFDYLQKTRGSGSNQWYKVVLKEGKYREVRRLWSAINCRVNRLIRIRYGPFILHNESQVGFYKELNSEEQSVLLRKSVSKKYDKFYTVSTSSAFRKNKKG